MPKNILKPTIIVAIVAVLAIAMVAIPLINNTKQANAQLESQGRRSSIYIGAITTNHPGEPRALKPLVHLFQICLRSVFLRRPTQNISATSTDQLIQNAYQASSVIELHNQDEVSLPVVNSLLHCLLF